MSDPTFGAALRRLRLARYPDVSQRRLGELAGLRHPTICRFENGRRTPAVDAVARIAAALELSDNELANLVRAADGTMPAGGHRTPQERSG